MLQYRASIVQKYCTIPICAHDEQDLHDTHDNYSRLFTAALPFVFSQIDFA